MRGRVPGTGFPHVLGVCGEVPRLHERDQHHVGAPQPPENGRSYRTRSGSSSQRPSRQMGRSEYSRQVLIEESLFRACLELVHPPCEVGGLVPTRNDAEPQRNIPATQQWFRVSQTGPFTV